MTRLLDKLAFWLHRVSAQRYLNLRLDADQLDGVSVRYRKGAAPAVSITWKSGTHNQQVALILSPERAAFVQQGIREALIEIAGESTAACAHERHQTSLFGHECICVKCGTVIACEIHANG